ncbi:MAG: UDP-N-acetylmuramate dehydrogenase [Oscillospiraceae bacterium]|nr:UDP-N-acetylmuramate dehydrogenase [Oscillospiraceae bacterium]
MIKSFLNKNNIEAHFDESMKKHTTFKVGGNAVCIAVPDTIEKAAALIKFVNENKINHYFLGNGSNVIFNDNGFDGVIIKTSALNKIDIKDNVVVAGAGVLMTSLAKRAQENSLSGLEFCYGIPGNVGGGIYMNAGAYGGEISNCLVSVDYIDENGNLGTISKNDCDFSYRHSRFMKENWLIVSATFEMEPKDSAEMLAFMEDIMQRRKDKQPLDKPSAGSSFKRPVGYFAAALIDECGLKGLTVGGAQVSEKHAGFIVNIGDATCQDIVDLADKVRQIVLEKKGVVLEKEMIIV